MVWTQEQHTLTENDHLGDWSPEKDCSSQDSSRPDDEVRFKLLGEKEFFFYFARNIRESGVIYYNKDAFDKNVFFFKATMCLRPRVQFARQFGAKQLHILLSGQNEFQ